MNLEEIFTVKLKSRYMVTVHFCNRVDEYNSMGNFTPVTREIKIKNDLTHEEKIDTLVHELLHAISDCYNLDLSESKVLTLEKAIMKIMKMNPDLKNLLVSV